jgi:hypothetical protein
VLAFHSPETFRLEFRCILCLRWSPALHVGHSLRTFGGASSGLAMQRVQLRQFRHPSSAQPARHTLWKRRHQAHSGAVTLTSFGVCGSWPPSRIPARQRPGGSTQPHAAAAAPRSTNALPSNSVSASWFGCHVALLSAQSRKLPPQKRINTTFSRQIMQPCSAQPNPSFNLTRNGRPRQPRGANSVNHAPRGCHSLPSRAG